MTPGRRRRHDTFDFGDTRRNPQTEVESELAFHFQETVDLLMAEGYDRSAAEEEAKKRFGDYAHYRDELEHLTRRRVIVRKWRTALSTLRQDLTYAFRGLVRSPSFTSGSALTLALGIGATAVVVSLIQSVILQPLPYPDPDALVRVYDTRVARGELSNSSSPANFIDWREDATSFSAIAAYQDARRTYTDVVPPEDLLGANVSAGWFDVMGVQPTLGRAFSRDDEVYGNHRVVIVSDGFWRRFLNADSAALGRTVTFEGEPHVLVGVMPPGFAYPSPETNLWLPLAFDFDVSTARGVHYLTVIARLAPEVTLPEASAEMDVIMSRLRTTYPDRLEEWGVRLESMHASIVGRTDRRLFMFLAAALLVLVVAWVNVANLVMARCTARAGEFGVRSALGADRWRLTRQLMIEGMLLTMVAGGIGLVMGAWGIAAVRDHAAGYIPRLETVGLDISVMFTVIGLSLVLGILLGTVPSISWGRIRSHTADWLRIGTGTRRHNRMRAGFVVAQIALAMVLTVGAGLLVRSYQELNRVDPGYDLRQALTATVAIPSSRYPEPATRSAMFSDIAERLEQVPGVQSAAVTTQLPLEFYSINFSYWTDPVPPPPGEESGGDFRVVSADYFETMGIPVRSGRTFTTQDTRDAPAVIVINESLARHSFPDVDPVGRHMYLSYGADDLPREIIGVVGDVKQRTLQAPSQPGYYLPVTQESWSSMRIVMRTEVNPSTLTAALRDVVAEVDPLLPVRDIRTLAQRQTAVVRSPQFNMRLILTFALVGVVLAISGIYSVTSFAVAQRTREIGIRMALGAQGPAVRRQVARGAITLALLGVTIGSLLAVLTTRTLNSFLFGVQPTDWRAFGAAVITFILVSWMGSFVPARRATRVDPIDALKAQ